MKSSSKLTNSHDKCCIIKNFSYNTSDQIGKGFSSVVYRGRHQLYDSPIAVKVIDMKGVKDSITQQMLNCEIQALTTIKHPNVLKCIDVVRQNNFCYIVTQYCNEGDLGALLKQKNQLSEIQTTKILKDIINGFITIADKGFLHRDLKLANIFMSNGKAIIADFGFAKKISNCTERENYNVGSPLYMSPEALRNNKYSIKNDVWSIGVMAYELLHGETPWNCRTEKELTTKMTTIPVKFKQSLCLSKQIRELIKNCLEINQIKRMSLDELKEWLKDKNSKQNKKFLNLDLNSTKQINKQNNTKALTLITKRLSQIGTKKSQKQFDKQNNTRQYIKSLPKTLLERNNNLLITQINQFRLLYKILEKLRIFHKDQNQLQSQIGNQVILRVNKLTNYCCEHFTSEEENPYQLKQAQIYLNEKKNPSIKKYLSVIKQYHLKYNKDIKNKCKNYKILNSMLQFLHSLNMKNSIQQQEMLMIFWIIEWISIQTHRQIKKQYLDYVIDPKKLKLNREYLMQRIKQL